MLLFPILWIACGIIATVLVVINSEINFSFAIGMLLPLGPAALVLIFILKLLNKNNSLL